MSAAPIPFRRPTEPRCCGTCEVPLAADAPSYWGLCKKCHSYAQLGRALQVFKAADDSARTPSPPDWLRVELTC